ncbi:MAG: NUDIX domain-containing protein [Neisseria sp.]|nr:NUDIX domain-containing protein [Neisseria sp.]
MSESAVFHATLPSAVQDALWQVVQQHFAHEISDFCPLFLNDVHLGYLKPIWRERIRQTWAGEQKHDERGVHLYAENWLQMGDALQDMCQKWHDVAWFGGWRNEKFDVCSAGGTPLFALERSAFRPLGLHSQAVHVNGWTQTAATSAGSGQDGIRFWIGKRSPYKAVDPNKLDNLTGGGVAAGEKIDEAMRREAWEEAGVPSAALHQAVYAGSYLSLRPVSRGLHRETLHIFHIELPSDFVPENQDGEVAEFVAMSAEELAQEMVAGKMMNDALLATLVLWQDLNLLNAEHSLSQHLRAQMQPNLAK